MAALDDTNHGARGFGSTGTKQLTHSSPTKEKKGIKKKNPVSLVPSSQQQQVQNSVNMVVSMGLGLLVRVGWPGDLPMDGR